MNCLRRVLRCLWTIVSLYGNGFDECLSNLERALKKCEEKNLVLNFEKCHFMVDKGIVLGHLVSKEGIQVDKVKIEVMQLRDYCYLFQCFMQFH